MSEVAKLEVDAISMAQRSRAAARVLATLSTADKNHALKKIAVALADQAQQLLTANELDVKEANQQFAKGDLSSALVARLKLTPQKLDQIHRSVGAVMQLADPCGQVLLESEPQPGLKLKKVSVPIGVIAAVIEARPDAVVQLSSLAIKSGNALMIKGGSEAKHTTTLLIEIMRKALSATKVPEDALIQLPTRESFQKLLQLPEYVDLVVPRGGAELIRHVQENSKVPVLSHADGVCHIFIDKAADEQMAMDLVVNAKAQAPATCNAVETVLIDQIIASKITPKIIQALRSAGVTVAGCERTQEFCKDIERVTNDDWHREYGDMKISVRVVDNLTAAIDHIHRYGSSHTDSIVTNDLEAAEIFLNSVDSANVFHNVSTRYSDGYRYGFGAEVGISTGKLHARGPVGLEGLVIYKYRLTGNGHLVTS